MRATLDVPDDLIARVDEAVERGQAHDRSEFVTHALRRALDAPADSSSAGREAIDRAFADMADDGEVQQEAAVIEREFARSSWEALPAAGE